MFDLKRYWQEIRAIEESLPEYVWLMSLDNPAKGQIGGSIVQAAAAVAAKLLQAKSHRLATDEETQAHLAAQDQARRDAFEKKLRDSGIAVVPVAKTDRS
jgi:hypothetical protein